VLADRGLAGVVSLRSGSLLRPLAFLFVVPGGVLIPRDVGKRDLYVGACLLQPRLYLGDVGRTRMDLDGPPAEIARSSLSRAAAHEPQAC
jgi:hypothetical protein